MMPKGQDTEPLQLPVIDNDFLVALPKKPEGSSPQPNSAPGRSNGSPRLREDLNQSAFKSSTFRRYHIHVHVYIYDIGLADRVFSIWRYIPHPLKNSKRCSYLRVPSSLRQRSYPRPFFFVNVVVVNSPICIFSTIDICVEKKNEYIRIGISYRLSMFSMLNIHA